MIPSTSRTDSRKSAGRTPWLYLKRLLLYTAILGFAIAAFHGLRSVSYQPLLERGIPGFWLQVILVTLIAGVLVAARYGASGLLERTVKRQHIRLRQELRELSEELERSETIEEAAQIILDGVEAMLDVPESQLTLYYDQPFALEVTHLHLKEGTVHKTVERVREDDPGLELGDEAGLTPVTAEHTEVLTHRDRLVGLLLLGKKRGGGEFTNAELELLEELIPIIASSIDLVVMIRHLSETNQRLFENEKLVSIGQLASGIAHEIRNPLTSIKMNLQGLRKSAKLNDRNQRRVQISLDEIDRLDAIVTELMSFARRTKLVVQPTRAEYLIDETLGLVESELKEREIKTIVEIEEDAPEIRVDTNRIIRALLNLVINAAQAMGTGGVIHLRGIAYGAGLEIQVSDEGPGIATELHRELFNPFFTTKAQGTGLGLANALKFAQEHGGELDFVTEIGVGTTFSLRLPPAPPSHLDDPTALKVVPT